MQGVEKDEVRGGNGIRCWGSLQAIERPQALMLHKIKTKGFEAEVFCALPFHRPAPKYPRKQKLLLEQSSSPLALWAGQFRVWGQGAGAVLCIVECLAASLASTH